MNVFIIIAHILKLGGLHLVVRHATILKWWNCILSSCEYCGCLETFMDYIIILPSTNENSIGNPTTLLIYRCLELAQQIRSHEVQKRHHYCKFGTPMFGSWMDKLIIKTKTEKKRGIVQLYYFPFRRVALLKGIWGKQENKITFSWKTVLLINYGCAHLLWYLR